MYQYLLDAPILYNTQFYQASWPSKVNFGFSVTECQWDSLWDKPQDSSWHHHQHDRNKGIQCA